ncbi:MAG: MATE family efflux transporter [Clostridia bacterium]|nr:MATE family efflux transporter [Clostridia bacterium]
MARSFEMNMSEGSLFKKIVLYALPLIATNVLQLLFNSADLAVLRMFIQSEELANDAVAAVGATGALINLIIGLFIGLSVGANVLIARYAGKGDSEAAKRVVGMSMVISVLFGVLLLFVGVFCSKIFLGWMGCDPEVIDMATKYMKIFFFGMPIMMLYNFSASILRAVGDTIRPLIFLVIGGVINLGMNIFLVTVFGMDVDGVAIATVASQGVSAVLCIITLLKSSGYARLEPKYIRFYKSELVEMIKIGLPSGLQGCMFSLSNVLIQSTVNSYGKLFMSGNTAAGQVEGYIYNTCNAISLTALAFVSQNYGAKKPDRIRKVVKETLAVVVCIAVVLSALAIAFSDVLCGLFCSGEEPLAVARTRMIIVGGSYILCGVMDVMGNVMRGLNKSTTAMVVSLSGSCLFRILWVNSFYLLNPCKEMLYVVYPISWVLTIAIYLVLYFPTMKKVEKRLLEE